MEILKEIAGHVEKGDSTSVKECIRRAFEQEISPENILNLGLIRGMDSVGKKFKKNEIFIPEVLISTRAMNSGMEMLRPFLVETPYKAQGKILIGTVKGDLHDIGKKIVSMVLQREGFEVIDAGIDVPKETFIKLIKKETPDILGLSALLTTTMSYMREIIEAVEEAAPLRQRIKIIIGGAPVTKSFAEEIRADGYAPDAESSVTLVKGLQKEKNIRSAK